MTRLQEKTGFPGRSIRDPFRTGSGSGMMTEVFQCGQVERELKHAVKVHPCIINSRPFLVHERNLRSTDPEAYKRLEQYTRKNGFGLKEDRRARDCQVAQERRSSKTMSVLFLAGGMFLSSAAVAEDLKSDSRPSYQEEIVVKGVREKSRFHRDYKLVDGKRFVSTPFGNVKAILSVAAQVKHRGNMKRVSTRGITMPHSYAGRILHRYDYQFPQKCGGAKFSYYEGEGFGALGLRQGKKLVLDVMVGGGAFSAPQLWGPYDQILGEKRGSGLKLTMGDGRHDGMGLMKASYAIGMMPDMVKSRMKSLGGAYAEKVEKTYACLVDMEDKFEQPIQRAADIRADVVNREKI